MNCVIVESPYAGETIRNVSYAFLCVKDCLQRGEAPYAAHLLYPVVLNDGIPAEREAGIAAGLCWTQKADKVVVYADFGISVGMQLGIDRANELGKLIEHRLIGATDGKDTTQ